MSAVAIAEITTAYPEILDTDAMVSRKLVHNAIFSYGVNLGIVCRCGEMHSPAMQVNRIPFEKDEYASPAEAREVFLNRYALTPAQKRERNRNMIADTANSELYAESDPEMDAWQDTVLGLDRLVQFGRI